MMSKLFPSILSLSLLVGLSTVSGVTPASADSAKPQIPGYALGDKTLAEAPFTLDDLKKLKATVLFTEKDAEWLRKSRAVLEPHAEELLDTWYGFVGATPHLLYYFNNSGGQPDGEYLARVRARFIQWVYDTADANYDQDWLNYQYEIGRRHHRVAKNKTDGATGPDHIAFRYVVALHYPVTATLRPFLERGDHSAEDVDAMHQAWIKSVLIQTILWSHPYIKDGDF